MVSNKNDLKSLETELEQVIERENLETGIKKPVWLYGILLVAILVLGFSAYSYFFGRQETYDNLDDYSESLVTDSQADTIKNWTYDDFKSLDWNVTSASKTTVSDIVDKFGTPSEITTGTIGGERESLTVYYKTPEGSSGARREVKLIFANFDDELTLMTKTFSNLPGVPYEDKIGKATHDWTQSEFNDLVVGDSKGKGGINLDDVLNTYGSPGHLETFGYNDEIRLSLQYSNVGDIIKLSFINDESDTFHLYQKSGTVND